MSFFSRVTEPLAPLDGAVNRLNDISVRTAPWLWWPAGAPRRSRPFDAGQHAAYLAWSAAGFLVAEALAARAPGEDRPTGRRLQGERIASATATLVLWIVAAGAWDRRAERSRRRPWEWRRHA